MDSAVMKRRTVKDALSDLRRNGVHFSSEPRYSELGDFLTIFFNDAPAYSERVDAVLTVYRSMANGDIVGCKIKGVSALAENVANIFSMQDGEVEIRLLLLNAAGPKKESRHFYYDLGAKCGQIAIPLRTILKRAA